jgi:hypothetical protein
MKTNTFFNNPVHFYIAGLLLAAALIAGQLCHHTITGYGKLMPMQQALLLNTIDGQVSFSSTNYLTGHIDALCLVQIERGEMQRLQMQPALLDQAVVEANDTLAVISSSALEEQLTALAGELAVARSTLAAEQSGEKAETIAVYQHRLEQAQAGAAEKERACQRLELLYEKKLTSFDLYDAARSAMEIAQAQFKLAESELAAINTGVKPKQVQLLQTQVSSLEKQIDLLKKRKNNYCILAPFAGRVATYFSSDTLLAVSAASPSVLLLPVRAADRQWVRPGAQVRCWDTNAGIAIEATVHRIKQEVFILNAQPMITVIAVPSQQPLAAPVGAIVKYAIACPASLSRLFNHRPVLGALF